MTIDAQSLVNYFDASRKLERENAELIAELRGMLTEILTAPAWINAGGIANVARLDVPKELYHRAWSLLGKSDDSGYLPRS